MSSVGTTIEITADNSFHTASLDPHWLFDKRCMMNIRIILILTLCLLFSVSAIVATSDATTTFGGSRIVAIDQDQRTITFKTNEGQTWTLPVTDPDLLNRQPIEE
jgi:hypothetical protein